MNPGTVLLLGAGASMPYGFPSGQRLKEKVIELCGARDDRLLQLGLAGARPKLHRLAEALGACGLASIDAFLSSNKQFEEEGCTLIAEALLHYEHHWRVDKGFLMTAAPSGVLPGDLYGYLWQRLFVPDFDALSLEDLKVVTFNYDRSLQMYLARAITHSYGVDRPKAMEKVRALEVVHVYGSLGDFFPDEPNYQDFGVSSRFRKHIEVALRTLRVIPQARDDDKGLVRAREVLTEAKQLVILGFGFDELNLERLHAPETLWRERTPMEKTERRRVVVCCMGKTTAEAAAIAKYLYHPTPASRTGQLPLDYWAADAVDTLRHAMVLGEYGGR